MKSFSLNHFIPLLLLVTTLSSQHIYSQHLKTDANIIGHVTSGEEHLPFVNVFLKGTNTGTTTDETGHFQLVNLPTGTYILRAQIIGYVAREKTVTLEKNKTLEINFDLTEDALGLEEIVVTGDRNEKSRKESSVAISTLSPKLFTSTQSVTLSEGLNFSPGLRMENNCQNCGFNQVRLNGMEGAYTQILIDGKPLFGGLAAVYGLEMIPAAMIKRVEVVKGGGSVLYGSNAIAGTINMILQEPLKNSYQFSAGTGVIGPGSSANGAVAMDYTVNMNGSVVSSDQQSGLSLFSFYRNRQPFDANDDGFSEISSLRNITAGTRLFHRLGERSKITADFFAINERRRGGNKFDDLPHEADIAESLEHTIINGAIALDTYFRDSDALSVYLSFQNVARDSYYGARQSLQDYGKTTQMNFAGGVQYLARFANSSLILGADDQGSILKDTKLGYPDFAQATIAPDSTLVIPHVPNTLIAHQFLNTAGGYTQYEIKLNKLTVSAGIRLDYYCIRDVEDMVIDNANLVFIPRANLLYDFTPAFQGRLSYSQGYRAPQIFDEDLHIESSGSRQVIHVNSPDLKQESSHSVTMSFDYAKLAGKVGMDFILEGFFTYLKEPFTNIYSAPDSAGTVYYTRMNATDGAFVAGATLECTVTPVKGMNINAGFTVQESMYETPQEFDERKFLRTPDNYGFLTLDYTPLKKLDISATMIYTGPMLVPYFGPLVSDPEQGELRRSSSFCDLGLKAAYTVKLNGASLQFHAGVKNILNSYQTDFDTGIDRDPGYIYGPMLPRTIYAGITFGNLVGSLQ